MEMFKAEVVRKSIQSIARRGKKLDQDIHATAIQCLIHREHHGDNTLARDLVDAMPKSGRRKALVKWFEDFGAMQLKGTEFKNVKDGAVDVDGANQVPFWEYTEENKPTEFGAEDLVKQLEKVAKGTQYNEEGKVKGKIISATAQQEARRLLMVLRNDMAGQQEESAAA